MKFKITTLGCKVNRYESEALSTILIKNGFSVCKDGETPDIFILNSCTVTATGDQKVRQTLRKERRASESAIIILTGCMAQAFPEKAEMLPEADIIMGTKNRNNIIRHITGFLSHKQRIIDIEKHENNEKFESMEIEDFSERTRAYIKIQDGCNRFCSYCIIPFARGRVRSKPLEDFENELHKIAQKDFLEVVLTGINLSCYGQDLDLTLYDAVKLACDNEKIQRVRLGSLEPELLDEELIIKLSKLEKLCPQFHLSMQSGCDETLKRMNRHYNTFEYETIVNNLRKHFDNPAITTDIMVGFPSETDEEFSKTLAFVEKIEFSGAHVFAYSRRSGTVADKMEDQIDNKTKAERSRKMISLTDLSKENYHKGLKGTVQKVLFETQKMKNVYIGHSPTYVPVICSSTENISGKIKEVLIRNGDKDYCYGELIK